MGHLRRALHLPGFLGLCIRAGGAGNEPDQTQARLPGHWKGRQRVSRRQLAHNITNSHASAASTSSRNQLAQRGHNRQELYTLGQAGFSSLRDCDIGLRLGGRLHPGNVTAAHGMPADLTRIATLLGRGEIDRDTVTLVRGKCLAAPANTYETRQAGMGRIPALP